MKKYISLTLLLLTGMCIRAQQSQVDCIANPPDFSKMSYNEANETSFTESDLIESGKKKICPEYVTNLVNQLRSERLSHDNEALAIDLLGAVRPSDSNSIEFFIQNIDFERTKFDDPNRFLTQSKYPCEAALMRIGQPVIIPILNHLPNETSQLRRKLMCDVLKQVWRQK